MPWNGPKRALSGNGYPRSFALLSTPYPVILTTSINTIAENINLTLFWCRVERQCTKDYSYDSGRIKIKKGQLVTVPAFALHHMEEYYPDPEKFDPERLVPLPKWIAWTVLTTVFIFRKGGVPKIRPIGVPTPSWRSALAHAIA